MHLNDRRDSLIIPVTLTVGLKLIDFVVSWLFFNATYGLGEMNPLARTVDGTFDSVKGFYLTMATFIILLLFLFSYRIEKKPAGYNLYTVKELWNEYGSFLSTVGALYAGALVLFWIAVIWNIFIILIFRMPTNNSNFVEDIFIASTVAFILSIYLVCAFGMRYIKPEIRTKNNSVYKLLLLPYKIGLFKCEIFK